MILIATPTSLELFRETIYFGSNWQVSDIDQHKHRLASELDALWEIVETDAVSINP